MKAESQNPSSDQLKSLIDLFSNSDVQEAFSKAKDLIEKFPKSPLLYNILGVFQTKLGNYNNAITLFNLAIQIQPSFPEALNNLGIALKENGDKDKSISVFRAALEIEPDSAETYSNLGNVLVSKGCFPDAVNSIKYALSIDPTLPEAYVNLGNAYQHTHEFDKSLAAYKKALELNPNSVKGLHGLGTTLAETGDLKGAIKLLNRALEIQPTFVQCFIDLKALYVQLQHFQRSNLFDAICKTIEGAENLGDPRYLVFKAIDLFLKNNLSISGVYIEKFNSLTQRELHILSKRDLVFCKAYSQFIEKLIEASRRDKAKEPLETQIIQIGESHCLSFAHQKFSANKKKVTINPKIIFGAKAYHFSKAEENRFKAIAREHFRVLSPGDNVFISFGEIDCRPDEGFSSAIQKLNKPLEEIIETTVSGYINWFIAQNKNIQAKLYFLNIPAPINHSAFNIDENQMCMLSTRMFNSFLRKFTDDFGCNLIDVYQFTTDKDGFSNGAYHVDNRHLGPQFISQLNTILHCT